MKSTATQSVAVAKAAANPLDVETNAHDASPTPRPSAKSAARPGKPHRICGMCRCFDWGRSRTRCPHCGAIWRVGLEPHIASKAMVEVIQSGVLARIRAVVEGNPRQPRVGLWVTESLEWMTIVFPTRHSGGCRSKAQGWTRPWWFSSSCLLATSTQERFQLLQDIVEIGPPAEFGGAG